MAARDLTKTLFHVTGFGKFAGVAANPTTDLIENLTASSSVSDEYVVGIAKVLEVSAVGSLLDVAMAKSAFGARAEEEDEQPAARAWRGPWHNPRGDVWLHFGVDASSADFALEQQGWNEANFRVADERGWQPSGQAIDGSLPRTHVLPTSLPLSCLAVKLQSLALRVRVSSDPGRFICNWIYYCQQRQAGAEPVARRPEVLFVHVPLFSVYDAPTQLRFAHALMAEIARYRRVEEQALRRFLELTDGAADAARVQRWWTRLVTEFRRPPRAYHNIYHIQALLDLSAAHLPASERGRELVDWAVFFHDAVYDPTSGSNEEDSAVMWKEFAADVLGHRLTPADVDTVESFILATKKHMDANPDPASLLAYFLDFDLAILGAEPHVYLDYSRAIRHEYGHVPSDAYRRGRQFVLKSFTARQTCYFTPTFQQQLSQQCRDNITAEIQRLEQAPDSDDDDFE